MTYSIVARDSQTGALGIAVASRFFAVGAIVPYVRGGVGAVATQAFPNPTFGPDGLRLMEAGMVPDDILTAFIERDDGHGNRQFHMIDAQGRGAAYTGLSCVDWAGHVTADGISVAGNMLEGSEVVEATLAAYIAAMELPFAERLLHAMRAGEDAGGDKRGKQSACLTVFHDQDYPWLNIRSDDHGDPLSELRRLYSVAQERFLVMAETMPTRENPHGMTNRTVIDARIVRLDEERRVRGEPSASHMQNKV